MKGIYACVIEVGDEEEIVVGFDPDKTKAGRNVGHFSRFLRLDEIRPGILCNQVMECEEIYSSIRHIIIFTNIVFSSTTYLLRGQAKPTNFHPNSGNIFQSPAKYDCQLDSSLLRYTSTHPVLTFSLAVFRQTLR